MSDDVEAKIREAISHPQNMGEMVDADAVGTVGSPDCGDMLRMWLKFKEKDGRKVIDKASFQSFGCQTAIAVASLATQMLAGKTVEEAALLSSTDLSEPLGPLPPMKIHCGQMVEGALKEALEAAGRDKTELPREENLLRTADNLVSSFQSVKPPLKKGKLKIVLEAPEELNEEKP